MKLLWHSDGLVDFEGQFYKLEHARLDTEFYGQSQITAADRTTFVTGVVPAPLPTPIESSPGT